MMRFRYSGFNRRALGASRRSFAHAAFGRSRRTGGHYPALRSGSGRCAAKTRPSPFVASCRPRRNHGDPSYADGPEQRASSAGAIAERTAREKCVLANARRTLRLLSGPPQGEGEETAARLETVTWARVQSDRAARAVPLFPMGCSWSRSRLGEAALPRARAHSEPMNACPRTLSRERCARRPAPHPPKTWPVPSRSRWHGACRSRRVEDAVPVLRSLHAAASIRPTLVSARTSGRA